MEQANHRLITLYTQWVNNAMSEEETAEFLQLLNSGDAEQLLAPAQFQIWKELQTNPPAKALSAEKIEDLIRHLPVEEDSRENNRYIGSPVHRIHFLKTTWFRYAAAILLIAGAAIYLYIQQTPHKELTLDQLPGKATDILPGGDKAILTLADGRKIVLDSAAIGALASQGNTNIIKLNAGALAYRAGSSNGEVLNNTVSTPKGGQYQVMLPDGTRVWLNAASSVTFPTVFGNNRKIMITGEAYLEVAKDNRKPFTLTAHGTEIEVLGTSFNVNAYEDETTVTTSLIDGSVKVLKDSKAAVLKPGEQCSFVSGRLLVAANADQEQTLAWKNGMFHFNQTNLADAMRQLARWYDVEVVYDKGVPNIKLTGEIKRDLTLSQILDGLGELGVKFRISGKQLIVHNDLIIK